MMRKKQFANFNLFAIRYPLTAIASLLHRLSGIFIFLLIPFLLWLLDVSSSSEEGFMRIQSLVTTPVSKIILWLFLTAFGYHLITGIRHIVMDIGFAERLTMARLTAILTLILSTIWAILIGIWLW